MEPLSILTQPQDGDKHLFLLPRFIHPTYSYKKITLKCSIVLTTQYYCTRIHTKC